MTRLTVVISVLCALYSPALAEEPAEQLKTAMVRVMEALQDPISREPRRLEERLDHIRGVLKESFDWQEASRLILWRHWGRFTQDERDEFTALFSDVTARSYLRMILTYRGEEITMVLLDEAIDGERAAVRTKLVSKDRVVPITYRFIGRESMWRVYDIAIDGVSVLSSSQSQIDRLIQHFGYGGMMKLLKLKQSQLVMEQTPQSTKIGRVDPSPASP
jgi:phospholipid transport system substrate-binding protein